MNTKLQMGWKLAIKEIKEKKMEKMPRVYRYAHTHARVLCENLDTFWKWAFWSSIYSFVSMCVVHAFL